MSLIFFTFSGPFLVSRTGDAGCSELSVKCANYCLNPDPTKNMFSFRQRGGGHGSRYPHKECVTTHPPNENVSKMDGAKGNNLY